MTQRWTSPSETPAPESVARPRTRPGDSVVRLGYVGGSAPHVANPVVTGPEVTIDDFERYFPHVPTALAIKECARLAVVRRYRCDGPVLDVGCGDGLFARMAFGDVEVWGIDIDAAEGRWAAASQAYAQVILADVTRAKLPERFFTTCVANCSLEHVPRIDLALAGIERSLAPGGVAYLFVPAPDWARHFTTVRSLVELGAPAVAAWLQGSIDRFFKHHHLYGPKGWERLVEDAGLELISVEPVLSTATTVAFEVFLLPSIFGWANKHLTTRWTNFPGVRRRFARPVYRVVKAVMDHADKTPTAEYLVVARRPEE